MARGQLPRGAGGSSRTRTVANAAKRAWPVVLEAYRRWDQLTPAQKERYRKMAAQYTQRGRDALARRRKR